MRLNQKRHPVTECSVDGCVIRAKAWTSGTPLCPKHHQRWKRYGDTSATPKSSIVPEMIQMMTFDIESRSREDCWKWEGPSGTKGYGKVGRRKATHISLELDGKPRPKAPANLALHSCDNKWCWNPGHLRWGTNQENAQDYSERWGYCPHCDHCN